MLPARAARTKFTHFFDETGHVLCYGADHFFLDFPWFLTKVRRETVANGKAYCQQFLQADLSQTADHRPATHAFLDALGVFRDISPLAEVIFRPSGTRQLIGGG
jgi:hypothetical protein